LASTWSWASVEVGVDILPDYTSTKRLVEIFDFHVESRSSSPYGPVVYGWINLQAPTLPVQLTKDKRNDYRAFFKLGDSDLSAI
jgi:hypothetical protein